MAALAGLPMLVKRHRRAALPLLAFALPFFIAIGSGRTVFFRYILPLAPLLCVTAALTVRAIAEWPRSPLRAHPGVVTVVAALLIGGLSLFNSVALDRRLARTDARVLAAQWLAPRLAAGHTLHDSGGDYVRLDLTGARFHEWRYDAAARSFGAGEAIPDGIVLYHSPLRDYVTVPESLRDLVRERYVLAHEERATSDAIGGVFDRQDAFFLPMAGFTGVERPGPNVRIYLRR